MKIFNFLKIFFSNTDFEYGYAIFKHDLKNNINLFKNSITDFLKKVSKFHKIISDTF